MYSPHCMYSMYFSLPALQAHSGLTFLLTPQAVETLKVYMAKDVT